MELSRMAAHGWGEAWPCSCSVFFSQQDVIILVSFCLRKCGTQAQVP